MEPLDPRSDEAYRRATEMAGVLAKGSRRRPVRDWLLLRWLRFEYWLGIR